MLSPAKKQERVDREGFDLSLEEVVIRDVGDDNGLAILLDTYLFEGQRRAGDVSR